MVNASELDVLMVELGRRRFRLFQFQGDRNGPDVLAAVHDWAGGGCDVLILRSEQNAVAFRPVTGAGVDVFQPPHVVWWYAANAVWTLRALLTLPPPTDPDAPSLIVSLPPGLGLPTSGRMPVRIRAPH